MSDRPASDVPDDVIRWAAERTPARVLWDAAGLGYRTANALALRADHAAARDAVADRLEPDDLALGGMPMLASRAATPAEHLLRPDLGRRLDPASRAELARIGSHGADVQAVIGDGLSATAVRAQVPRLLPELRRLVDERGWRWGTPVAVRHCRVGIVNEIGDLLDPTVVVLLIGERPGLGVADSLSAYLAWRPRPGCTDADRNLISNIHDRGVPPLVAAARIVAYVAALRDAGGGGVTVKDPTS